MNNQVTIMAKKKNARRQKTKNAKIQFTGGKKIMKELQRMLCFRAYNELHGCGQTFKQKEFEMKLHEQVFGDGTQDTIGLAQQLLQRSELVAPLFDDVQEFAEGKSYGELKALFHRQKKKIVLSPDPADQGITMAVLSRKNLSNQAQISGRTVFENARQVLASCKKLMALLENGTECYRQGCPSGKNYDDYLEYCLDIMWKHRHENTPIDNDGNDIPSIAAASSSAGDEDDDADSVCSSLSGTSTTNNEGAQSGSSNSPRNEGARPKDWLFEGFFAWALWGFTPPPGIDERFKAKVFLMDDKGLKRKADGRAAIRKENLDEPATKKKLATSYSSAGNNGPSLSTSNEGGNLHQVLVPLLASVARQNAFQEAHVRNLHISAFQASLERERDRVQKEIEKWEQRLPKKPVPWWEMTNDEMKRRAEKGEMAFKRYLQLSEKAEDLDLRIDNLLRLDNVGSNRQDEVRDSYAFLKNPTPTSTSGSSIPEQINFLTSPFVTPGAKD